IYVGPKSQNPDQAIYKRDMNNFGPAVGFAWNIPWGGQGKTVLRGGYQVQYTGSGRGFVLDTAIGNPPGSSNTANYIIPATDPYFSVEKLLANPGLVPVQPLVLPNPTSTIIPVTDRTGLMNAFDPNFVSPYIQNLTLSLTRNLTSKLTMDLRYIGTLQPKASQQHRPRCTQLPIQRLEGSIRRGKARRRLSIARSDVQRTQHWRNELFDRDGHDSVRSRGYSELRRRAADRRYASAIGPPDPNQPGQRQLCGTGHHAEYADQRCFRQSIGIGTCV